MGSCVPSDGNHQVDNSINRHHISNKIFFASHHTYNTLSHSGNDCSGPVDIVDPSGKRLSQGSCHDGWPHYSRWYVSVLLRNQLFCKRFDESVSVRTFTQ